MVVAGLDVVDDTLVELLVVGLDVVELLLTLVEVEVFGTTG